MIGDKNWRVAWVSALLLCVASCATTGSLQGASAQNAAAIADPPARTGARAILIAMPNSPNFVEVRRSLVSELQKNFNIQTFVVGPGTKTDDLAAAIKAADPVCVVLMNNATISLYRHYQMANPTVTTPPAVLLNPSHSGVAPCRKSIA